MPRKSTYCSAESGQLSIAGRRAADDVGGVAEVMGIAHRRLDALAQREVGEVDVEDAVVTQVAVERGSDEDTAAAGALANDMLAFGWLEAGEEIGLLAQGRAMVARYLTQAVLGLAQHLEGRLELQRCVDHVHAATAGLFENDLRIGDSGVELLP